MGCKNNLAVFSFTLYCLIVFTKGQLAGSSGISSSVNGDTRQTFNRPPDTRSLAVPSTGFRRATSFGLYGSYRNHPSWINAVMADRQRHTFIHDNLRDTFPWLFRNLKLPMMSGFGLSGMWNSYAPMVPEGTHRMRGIALPGVLEKEIAEHRANSLKSGVQG